MPWHGEGALLLLSGASGAADAFVFLCVGQVFAGVMTGNLVLLGASAAGAGEDGVALKVAVALGAYFCGVAAGALLTGRRGPRVRVLLGAEVVLLGRRPRCGGWSWSRRTATGSGCWLWWRSRWAFRGASG